MTICNAAWLYIYKDDIIFCNETTKREQDLLCSKCKKIINKMNPVYAGTIQGRTIYKID